LYKLYYSLFSIFFKIGAFTLGGGYAMLPLIQREVVEKNAWVDEEEFLELLAMAQSAPGPIAVNVAVFVGYKVAGLTGCLLCTLGTVLPSFFIILLIAMYFFNFRSNLYVEGFFKGLKPAVVALIAVPAINMAKKNKSGFLGIMSMGLSLFFVAFYHVSPVWVILAAAIGAFLIK
jgi:chromate transporter